LACTCRVLRTDETVFTLAATLRQNSELSTTGTLKQIRRPAAGPPDSNLVFLLTRFDARCNQTNVVHASLVSKINHFGNLAEVQILITLHEHNLLLPR